MAEYFILECNKTLSNIVRIKNINKDIPVDYTKNNYTQFINASPVMYYVEAGVVFTDFIENPVHLISNGLWAIFDELQLSGVFYKPVLLANTQKMSQNLYWLIVPRKIDCLSRESEFNKDGTLKTLKIDKEKIGLNKIFKIEGITEELIILHQDIVNAIIMDVYGCVFRDIG
jgi:hypothetical protein